MTTRAEAIEAAGRTLAQARAERDALPARLAAERAHYAGGPSVDEIEAQILRHRALGHANVVIGDVTNTDELVRLLNKQDQRRHKPECGLTWFFGTEFGDIFSEAPSLTVGVRGEVGALMWFTETHEFAPAHGLNQQPMDYFDPAGHHFVMPAGTELPIAHVHAALCEYIRTGQRPTCVEWVEAPD